MAETYTAFGLTLRSSFPIAGMAPAEDGGPQALDLVLETARGLEAAWSGARDPSLWRGRLGDGRELTIKWGREGDLLFAYGQRARFHLDPSAALLRCAPREAADLGWQRVLVNRVLPNVSLARGREALHASAVQTPLGVLAIAAPSGGGKSTLAVEMMRRGWPLFADDVLVLGRGRNGVEAMPSSPHMNVAIGAVDPPPAEELGETLGILNGERWIAVRSAARETAPVAAVALLERKAGLALEAQPLPSSPLPSPPTC